MKEIYFRGILMPKSENLCIVYNGTLIFLTEEQIDILQLLFKLSYFV